MLKKDDKVIINNRGKKEFGTIIYKWRRKDVSYFNVRTEKGIEYNGLTTDPSFSNFIIEDLSIKLNQSKLCQLG